MGLFKDILPNCTAPADGPCKLDEGLIIIFYFSLASNILLAACLEWSIASAST